MFWINSGSQTLDPNPVFRFRGKICSGINLGFWNCGIPEPFLERKWNKIPNHFVSKLYYEFNGLYVRQKKFAFLVIFVLGHFMDEHFIRTTLFKLKM